MGEKKVDIAIIGAGMVGCSLAVALRNSGYTIALVDAQTPDSLLRTLPESDSVATFEPRVSALTFASRDLLKDCGAWDLISAKKKLPYQKMHVWDENGTAAIDFDAAELYQNELGYIVENQSIVSALHQCLEGQKNVDTFFGQALAKITNIEKDGATIHRLQLSDGGTLECSLLVAADGANSRVRNWLNVSTREWDYQHHAIVATIKTEKAHQHTAWQRFSESGPVAFLPLQDINESGSFCSIVWSQTPERATELMSLNDEDFCAALARETEHILGAVVEVSKRYSIPLRQRHAKDYTKPGLVLIGDAAHTIHPLAGQGVNLGFKDVSTLSKLINDAGLKELAPNSELYLKRFQRERQGDNLLMMGAMEGFKRLFASSDPLVRLLRNTGLDFVNKQGFIKQQLAKHAMGLPLV